MSVGIDWKDRRSVASSSSNPPCDWDIGIGDAWVFDIPPADGSWTGTGECARAAPGRVGDASATRGDVPRDAGSCEDVGIPFFVGVERSLEGGVDCSESIWAGAVTDRISIPLARSLTVGFLSKGLVTGRALTVSAPSSVCSVDEPELPSSSEAVTLPDPDPSLRRSCSGVQPSGFQLYALSSLHFFAGPSVLRLLLLGLGSSSSGMSTLKVLANGHAVLS